MIRRLLALLTLLGLSATSCDNGATVLNAAPNVTAVGPVVQKGDSVEAWIWIRDHERDSADVTLVVAAGGSETPVTQVGGNGLTGLTTAREATGEPHLVTFPSSLLSGGAQLQVTATDRDGGAGPTFVSAAITFPQGLPTP